MLASGESKLAIQQAKELIDGTAEQGWNTEDGEQAALTLNDRKAPSPTHS